MGYGPAVGLRLILSCPPLPPKKENLTLKSSKFPEQRFYFEVPFPASLLVVVAPNSIVQVTYQMSLWVMWPSPCTFQRQKKFILQLDQQKWLTEYIQLGFADTEHKKEVKFWLEMNFSSLLCIEPVYMFCCKKKRVYNLFFKCWF